VKVPAILLLLSLLIPAAGTAEASVGGPATAASVSINGRYYVRFSDWAKSRGFSLQWLRPEKTLQATGKGHRLVIGVNSRELRFNGSTVWLCFPVLLRGGAAYVSRLDVHSTLQPLVSPSRARSSAPIRTICLDPGHGGRDPGFRVGSTEEQRQTLLLAQEVREQLTQEGFRVVLTRTTDRFVDHPDRVEIARQKHADLFISLHYNAANTRSAQGCEVYCLTPAGAFSTNVEPGRGGTGDCPGNRSDSRNILLAYHFQRSLTRDLGMEDRGVRRARFAVLREASMPAVLLEAGFLSHPVEGRRITDAAHRRKTARAIVSGVQSYKRVVEGTRS
jgi:N-acetylmuramoyl-L-alanine amidase